MPFSRPIQPPFRTGLADQLWFILETGPYYRQARENNERVLFLSRFSDLWFHMWPVVPVSEDDTWVACRRGLTQYRFEADLEFAADIPNVQIFDGTWREYLEDKRVEFDKYGLADFIDIPTKPKPAPPKDDDSEGDNSSKNAKPQPNSQADANTETNNVETEAKETEPAEEDPVETSKRFREELARVDQEAHELNEALLQTHMMNHRRRDGKPGRNRDPAVIPKFLKKVREAAGPAPEYIVLDDDSDDNIKPSAPAPKKRKISQSADAKSLSSKASTSST